jgi:DNA-binding NtrC family response regulator
LLLATYPFNLRDLQALLTRAQLRVTQGMQPSAALHTSLLLGRPAEASGRLPRAPSLATVRTTMPLSEVVSPRLEPLEVPRQVVRWRPDPGELRRILRECHGYIEQVAVLLQRDRKQVYRWLEYAGISREAVAAMRGAADLS